MKLTTRCHMKALSNTVELSLVASVIALAADVCWLIHDVIINRMSATYATVGTGLVMGLAITVYAIIGHHKEAVRCDLKDRYTKFKTNAAVKANARAKRKTKGK